MVGTRHNSSCVQHMELRLLSFTRLIAPRALSLLQHGRLYAAQKSTSIVLLCSCIFFNRQVCSCRRDEPAIACWALASLFQRGRAGCYYPYGKGRRRGWRDPSARGLSQATPHLIPRSQGTGHWLGGGSGQVSGRCTLQLQWYHSNHFRPLGYFPRLSRSTQRFWCTFPAFWSVCVGDVAFLVEVLFTRHSSRVC